MRVKRPKNVKYFFYKTNAEKNGTFNMQIILKVVATTQGHFVTLDLSYQYGLKNIYSQFEQLSVILVVPLLLTFKNI